MIELICNYVTHYIAKDKIVYITTYTNDSDGYIYKKTYYIDFVFINEKITWKTYSKDEYEAKLKEVLS